MNPADADTQPVDIMEIKIELPQKKEHMFGADERRQAGQDSNLQCMHAC